MWGLPELWEWLFIYCQWKRPASVYIDGFPLTHFTLDFKQLVLLARESIFKPLQQCLLVVLRPMRIFKAVWKKSITMDSQVCHHSQTDDIFKYIYTPTYTCMDMFYIYIYTPTSLATQKYINWVLNICFFRLCYALMTNYLKLTWHQMIDSA